MNENTIQDLLSLKEDLLNKVASIDQILTLMGGDRVNMAKPSVKNSPYKRTDNYAQKLGAILKEYKRFLNIREMAAYVNDYERNIPIEEAKKHLQIAKNLLINAQAIVKYQVDTNNSNTFYGLPSWLGEYGKPKEEFMYNQEAVLVRSKIEI